MPNSQKPYHQALLDILHNQGPSSAKSLCQSLSISQPTLSRHLKTTSDIIKIGKTKSSRYALKRILHPDLSELPLFQVSEKGSIVHLGELIPIHPQGFAFISVIPHLTSDFFEDLPFFLEDMRPQGFLGRLIPKKHPELQLPQDITHWNNSHCLFYLTKFGHDTVGDLIIGHQASQNWQKLKLSPKPALLLSEKKQRYPELAEQILKNEYPGSSAAGEQPKFLISTETNKHVLVKFSPPTDTVLGKRWQDLLICEHIAAQVLQKNNISSVQSEVSFFENRTFLETIRYDRVNNHGRKGVLSLSTLALEFTGDFYQNWTDLGKKLHLTNLIDKHTQETMHWLDCFGSLIANTDRHNGNLSFFSENFRPTTLTPIYDMLPMLYKPVQNQIIAQTFTAPLPNPKHLSIWKTAYDAAIVFWHIVQNHNKISKDFKQIATENRESLEQIKDTFFS